jgi:hypothetical protein
MKRTFADYVFNAFERVWQVLPGEQSELLRAWREVWHEMGNVLQMGAAITNIDESFPCMESEPEIYDFQAYRPLLTLF